MERRLWLPIPRTLAVLFSFAGRAFSRYHRMRAGTDVWPVRTKALRYGMVCVPCVKFARWIIWIYSIILLMKRWVAHNDAQGMDSFPAYLLSARIQG
jgi:hypothetical protein